MRICTRPLVLDSCTDALGQPIPEALVAGGESKPGSPQPVDLNSTAIGSCLVAVAVAVAFTLLICEHQLAVDTVSIEQPMELLKLLVLLNLSS
jgi:hypothetical protein